MMQAGNGIDLSQNVTMKQTVEIQNLKCGGCGTTIKNKLQSLKGVKAVAVDLENNTVSFSSATNEAYLSVEKMLSKLGYPLATNKNNLGAVAKSYISCALGKLEQ